MSLHTDRPGRAVADAAARARAPLGPRVLGAVVLAIGLFLLWEAYRETDGDLAVTGPRLAPLVITAGWVIVSAWYLIAQFVSPTRTEAAEAPEAPEPAEAVETAGALDAAEAAEATGRIEWVTPAVLAAALVGYVLLLEPVGFLLASVAFFLATARILGSRRLLRDGIVAVLLPLAIYLAFTRLLDIPLPPGVLPL